jgi:hypothetical protein
LVKEGINVWGRESKEKEYKSEKDDFNPDDFATALVFIG